MKSETISSLVKKQFEEKGHKEPDGCEFWYATELQKLLGYKKWEEFEDVIKKAQTSCRHFNKNINMHWVPITKTPNTNPTKQVKNYKLSRYACYLIAQNGDPKKKEISLAQSYFAMQTRKQEMQHESKNKLTEDLQRLRIREEIKVHNKSLAKVAKKCGIEEPRDFGIFHNEGYKGLYGGRNKKDIARLKRIPEKDDVLDHMGSEESAANYFRVTQTEAQLKKDKKWNKENANDTHFNVGEKIRKAMVNKPEDLPTPKESIKELKKQNLIKKNKEDEKI